MIFYHENQLSIFFIFFVCEIMAKYLKIILKIYGYFQEFLLFNDVL